MGWATAIGVGLAVYDAITRDEPDIPSNKERLEEQFDIAKKTAFMRHLQRLASLNPRYAKEFSSDPQYQRTFFEDFDSYRTQAFTEPSDKPPEDPETQDEARERRNNEAEAHIQGLAN